MPFVGCVGSAMLGGATAWPAGTVAGVYVPTHFAADDTQVAQLLAARRSADLVTMTDGGLVATFLPFLHDPAAGTLRGHLARTNDQWSRPPVGEALVIVHGPDAYITPSWYATKAEHGRVVPTWNYTTAHVYGRLVVHDDPDWVGQLVHDLTEYHESAEAQPWSVDDAPERFVAGQLRAIVGVEIEISRVEAKVKMSQNRPEADRAGVAAGLAPRNPEAAKAVRAARPAR